MYIMEQKSILKSSIWKVFEIFVDEPLKINYIKEISRKIKLAPTSVKKHIEKIFCFYWNSLLIFVSTIWNFY